MTNILNTIIRDFNAGTQPTERNDALSARARHVLRTTFYALAERDYTDNQFQAVPDLTKLIDINHNALECLLMGMSRGAGTTGIWYYFNLQNAPVVVFLHKTVTDYPNNWHQAACLNQFGELIVL